MNHLDPFKQLEKFAKRKVGSKGSGKTSLEMRGKDSPSCIAKNNMMTAGLGYRSKKQWEERTARSKSVKDYVDSITEKNFRAAYSTRTIRELGKYYGIGLLSVYKLIDKFKIKRKHDKSENN